MHLLQTRTAGCERRRPDTPCAQTFSVYSAPGLDHTEQSWHLWALHSHQLVSEQTSSPASQPREQHQPLALVKTAFPSTQLHGDPVHLHLGCCKPQRQHRAW